MGTVWGPGVWGPGRERNENLIVDSPSLQTQDKTLAFLSHSEWVSLGGLVLAICVVSQLVFTTTGVYGVPPVESVTLGCRYEPDRVSPCPRGTSISMERQTLYVGLHV